MDNPAISHLIPAPLQNKKEVLFGNMPEIYHFHKRWMSAIWLSLMIPALWLDILLAIEHNQHFNHSSSLSFLFHDFAVSRTFLRELEQYTNCPELVGRCFLERVSESWDLQRRDVNPAGLMRFPWIQIVCTRFLRWQTCRSMRSTVTTSLALKASGGSAQTVPSSRWTDRQTFWF